MDDDTPQRDPAQPTREELIETAAAEGLAASEEETDPDYVEVQDEAAPATDDTA